MKKEQCVQIAGQAVLEGVMMKSRTSQAIAVRDENDNIRIESKRLPPRSKASKIPFVRGVINLVSSMIEGTQITIKSAEVAAEEVQGEKGVGMGFISIISTLLGLALAMGLFVFLPIGVTKLFNIENEMLVLLIEGLIKTAVIIGYFFLVSLIPDIKRTFMYHGAEHKTIACFEQGKELTVENVASCSKHHDRCGTSFVVFVIIISVIVSMLFGLFAKAVNFTAFFQFGWVRALIKIALLPFVASICYELLMLFARSNFFLWRPLKWLGKQMQKITTREPTAAMIEVAIAAHKEVELLDGDKEIAEKHFPPHITLKEFKEQVKPLLEYKTIESSDLDWILCAVLNVKRSELKNDLKIPFGFSARIERMLKECAAGKPLQYVLGNTEFCGNLFYVNEDALIPRMETELVCEELIKRAGETSSPKKKILDLCCGSGCIGITAALKTKHYVTCADISSKALKLTAKNAKLNKAELNIVKSDMFKNFTSKFDFIVCNPPYIATKVIETLDEKVKNYEPKLALDGGEDGLKFYKIIAQDAPHYLYKEGVLILEIGYDQEKEVVALLQENFTITQVKKDYGGHSRVIVASLKKK